MSFKVSKIMNKLQLYTGQHPLKNDDFDFLQAAYNQGLRAAVSGFAAQGSGYLILNGCTPLINPSLSTAAIDVYDVSEGYMVYDYEVIFCPTQQISVAAQALLQYRIDEQPTSTGTRQYANGTVNECHFVRNIIIEEYDQIGVEVNAVMKLENALDELSQKSLKNQLLPLPLASGWSYLQNAGVEIQKQASTKMLRVTLNVPTSFQSLAIGDIEVITTLPVGYRPSLQVFHYVAIQVTPSTFEYVNFFIQPNGELMIQKISTGTINQIAFCATYL